MKDKSLTFPSMHADHRNWQNEHSLWRDDIDCWRAQLKDALTLLAELAEKIGNHERTLDEHADAIARQEHSLKDHEKGMARYLSEGADAEGQEGMVKNHCQQVERQESHRAAHERLKKQQHTVMAQLAMVKAAINSEM